MLENIIAKYRDDKIVTSLGDRRYNVQDKDTYRYFGKTDFDPIVATALPDQNVVINATKTVSISDVFSDKDVNRPGNSLSFIASSSDNGIVAVNIQGTDVILKRAKLGNVVVTLTAKDLFGNSVISTFNIEEVLWISAGEGGNKQFTVYRITTAGVLISSFVLPISPTQIHGLDFAPDGTLWLTTRESLGQGKIKNVSVTGSVISSFDTNAISNLGGDIVFDAEDSTLWAVDADEDKVYNITTAGVAISDFSVTGKIDASATRPRGITIDTLTRTLWICDFDSDKIYNSSFTGSNISEFPTSAYDASASSPTGISYSPGDATLWITDLSSDKVYNVELDGTLISSFNKSVFGLTTKDMSGISFV